MSEARRGTGFVLRSKRESRREKEARQMLEGYDSFLNVAKILE